MNPHLSVIVGTYNHLSYLKLCLTSLERQSFNDFEVIVADDGSGPEIKEWLKTYSPSFPLTHLWQEDNGFRKCRILNKAVRKATTEYIVFVDADCILSKNFLSEHWNNRKKGIFLGGRRVLIAQKIAETVKAELIEKGVFDGVSLWGTYHALKKNIRYYEEAFSFLDFFRRRSYFNLIGCNFSIHKSDVYLVHGFDEEYESRGGGEDTDIALRLETTGCRMKSVRYCAIQFHLGHEIPEDKSKSAKMFFEKKKKIKTPDDAKRVKSLL